MVSSVLQPQPEGDVLPEATCVSPERLAEFDRLFVSGGITAVINAVTVQQDSCLAPTISSPPTVL